MTAPTHTPVSRAEIADCVACAFGRGSVDRTDLVAAASSVHARPEVIATLEGLPNRGYGTVRDLWVHLPGLPITTEAG